MVWLDCRDPCPGHEECVKEFCYDPTTALVYDDLSWANYNDFESMFYKPEEDIQKVKDQMTYLSWPDVQRQAPESFIFDDSAGEGVTVYILDTGANLQKPEFDHVRERVRWLPADTVQNDGRSAKLKYHGTAMLSLIAGKTLDIAKKVNPVIVRLPKPAKATGSFSPQDFIDYLGKINDDLGPGSHSQTVNRHRTGMIMLVESLMCMHRVRVQGYNILVADGSPENENDYAGGGGTSDAAAYTAGLAAYFIRLAQKGQLKKADGSPVPNTPLDIKNFVVNSAWSRRIAGDDTRPGIFNGIDIDAPRCPWVPSDSLLKPRAAGTCTSGSPVPSPTQTTTAKSSTATHQPAPSASSIVPLVPLPVQCHKASNFPGHGDISGSAVSFDAEVTCESWYLDTLSPGDPPLKKTVTTSGINYDFKIAWFDDCDLPISNMTVWNARGLGGDSSTKCASLFYDCWNDCDNTGVGGHIDIGCFRYTFTGGAGDS
ncbi:uncharacterized protein LTR77_002427 [Saxophila tyrrhenica]|uniref:Uncharacterized protein n=1 Tax=Saxophila tyrrhenica TaxID=1690608 RepID=A0AAV9PNA2_9PEZI|nr:hypothetical protein LTR77_002427 [Saxophila tyrrhenica]